MRCLLVMALFCIGCCGGGTSSAPVPVQKQNGFTVYKLFELNGFTMYRFREHGDYGNWVYFSLSEDGKTRTQYNTSGKGSYKIEAEVK